MTPVERAELRRLHEEGTEAPWYVVGPPWRNPDGGTHVVARDEDPHVGTPVLNAIDINEWNADEPGPDYSQSDADLALAAAARNALPRLLDQLERYENVLRRIRDHGLPCDRMCRSWNSPWVCAGCVARAALAGETKEPT